MRVLIVDDDKLMRAVISAFISEIGHEVVLAEHGEQALEIIGRDKINLILLDVEMPKMDGFVTARKIRGLLGKQWIPIVFLSARTGDDHFVEGIEAGGDAYLPKPPNGPVIQAMVKAMGRISDVQEALLAAKVEMEKLAHLDTLTQVVNRRGFDNYLSSEWLRAKRNQMPISIIMIDIDHFKKYNDGYGHGKGDTCLKNVAGALDKAVMRAGDMLARYGGEEFVVLLPETDLEGAQGVAERIKQAVANAAIPHEFSDTSKIVTLSMGVAQKTDEENMRQLMAKADKNLYEAKESGRNRYIAQ